MSRRSHQLSRHSVTFTSNGESILILNEDTKQHVMMKLTEFNELNKLVQQHAEFLGNFVHLTSTEGIHHD
tara:strand:+ start:267 stop:476 length:210 start_codon:yes stop_codon:yes gene_type:complete